MPRMKSNITKAVFNTSIRMEIFTEFRDYCQELNYPMNIVIEAFMEAFANGEYRLTINEDNRFQILPVTKKDENLE